MRRRTLDPWFYDIVCDHYANSVVELEEGLPKLESEAKRGRDQVILSSIGDPSRIAEFDSRMGHAMGLMDQTIENERKFHGFLTKAHPIAVGAATLDSLLHAVPEDYHYVREEKLPFNPLFFDFHDNYPMSLPFSDETADMNGIFMTTERDNDRFAYLITVLFSKYKKLTHSLDIITSYEKESSIYCILEDKRESDVDVASVTSDLRERKSQTRHFLIAPEQRKVFLSSSMDAAIKIQSKKFTQRIVAASDFDSSIDYDPNSQSDGQAGSIAKLTNLTVNLINYINSHNVSVIRKEREVRFIERDERNKKHKRSARQPFYIVMIRDDEYTEPDAPVMREGRQLEYRLYNRGHDRRYRYPDRSVKLVVWIKPYIKGPAEAPFFDQRHMLLATKLIAEQKMMQEYLNR